MQPYTDKPIHFQFSSLDAGEPVPRIVYTNDSGSRARPLNYQCILPQHKDALSFILGVPMDPKSFDISEEKSAHRYVKTEQPSAQVL